MNYLTARGVAAAMGGKVSPSNPDMARVPGPGHSKHDDGLVVFITDADPEGFTTYSHHGDDWRDCRDYVREKLGLERPDFRKKPMQYVPPKPKGERTGHKRKVAEYVYLDKDGNEYHKVNRFEFEGGAKTFTQEHFEIESWVSGDGNLPPIPYNLPSIIARHDEPIWLVEGEKNADDLIRLGFVATTAKGGASAFPTTPDFAQWFDGSTVYALPDNDEPGNKWAATVSQVIPHAKIVRIPGLPPKGDVSDWIAAGGTPQALISIASSDGDNSKPSTALTPTPFTWVDPASIPQREVLYGSHLYRKFVSVTVSPGGVGKSSLVMMEAICMASNEPKLGERIFGGPFRVWYWNGEDPQDENIRRVVAAAVHHKIKPESFSGRLWVDSGRDMQIKLASMARGELDLNDDLFIEIEEALIARQIDVLIIDPLVSAHLVSENDNGAIDAIIKRLGRVAERAKCAIELVHHVRKPSSADAKVDVHDARGAGALIAGVRSARILNGMTEDEARDAQINPDDRFSYFQVDLGKSNLSKRDGRSKWRCVVGVGLGNGSDVREEDMIGVVEVYEKPSFGVFPDDAAIQAQRLAESRDTYRHWTSGPPSSDWFGFAIARLFGLDDEKDRKAIRNMIKTWLKAGVLTTREGSNGQNNHVVYIASARTAPDSVSEPTSDPDDSPF